MGLDDEFRFRKAHLEQAWLWESPLFQSRARRALAPLPKLKKSGLSVKPDDLQKGLPKTLPQGSSSRLSLQAEVTSSGNPRLSKSASVPDVMSKTWHPSSMSSWGKLEPLTAPSESPKSQGSRKGKKKKLPEADAMDMRSEELELEALGGSVPVALNEISTAALQVKEVMQELLHTADTMCDQSMDYEHDLIFLKEIGSSATQIAESLAMPMEKPSEDPIYSDSTLERAKRLAALSYELVEDIEMATDGYEEAAAQKGDEVACLNNVTKATCLVIEDMQRLQGERWAAGALAEILEEERRASMEKGDEKEDEAVLQVVAEDHFCFGEDPRMALLLKRTLARVRGESNGFDDAEKEDLHAAFLRFKVPDSADIHKDDLDALLNFVGRWVPPEEAITEMARKITMYDYMDFDEFLTFMTYYDEFERAEQQRIFKLYDKDGSGNISITELRCLLSGLGMLTLRQMMQEALGVVDKDFDGELNFEELCCFLAVYRGSEGFTKEEVESLKQLFDSEAVEEEEKPGVRSELPSEAKLPGKHLPSLLIQAFGMQVADNVEELQQQLASGQGFRKTSTTDSGESGSATISFKEFLILARRTRQMEMIQLTKEMPGLINTPAASGTSGDFTSADSDGNGTISSEELYDFLIGKEFTPLKKVVQEILQETAAEAVERSEGLDFNQFFDFLFIFRKRDGFSRAEVDRLRKGFNEYDQDGSGSISTLELSDIFRDFGYRVAVETLHHYIDRVDEDGSNQLDFREFLRLMRWHRESELDKYKGVFNRYKVTHDGVEGIMLKNLKVAIDEVGAVGDVSIIEAQANKLPTGICVDFDLFVDVVDASRLEYVRQEKKKAGFTDEELQRYTESFQKIDRDGSGSIEGKELLKLLEAFGWEPRSKHEREVLMERLNTARKRAREAEAPKVSADDGAEFGYWEFIQLARELNTLHEKAKEQAMNQLMEEVQFNQKEVNQFHEVFLYWLHVDEDEEVAEKAKELDHTDAGLTRELVRRVVRNTGLSLGPERKEALDVRLDTLEEDGKLKFHGFLRLMRWILETDFGEISSHMQQQPKK